MKERYFRKLINETTYKRGDIVIVDFGAGIGSEQGGVRPALIIQNDKGNHYSPTLQVAPITSKFKKALPTHMKISTTSGLETESIVMFEQSRAIDKQRVINHIGHISMGFVEDIKIAISFGCISFLNKKYEKYVTLNTQHI